jgi:hypothetical protein
MRTLLALVLIAGIAAAIDAPGELIRILGGERAWMNLPEWRQKDILRRYEYFRRLPAARQLEVQRKKGGLKAFLIKPRKRFRLPESLAKDIAELPREVRPLATKLVVLRLRHARLDRALRLLPFEQRRPIFRRLFPEPFDSKTAERASRELKKLVSLSIVKRLRPTVKKAETELGRPLDENEKAELVKRFTRAEEEKVVAPIRKELRRFRARSPRKIQITLEREGYPQLERLQLGGLSPRQREVLRYAFRPETCPWIDLRFLGPKPKDPAEKRLWERDFRSLARIDILSETRLPPEIVLHLASANSSADFWRAVKALLG